MSTQQGNQMTERATCTIRALVASTGIAYELAASIAEDAGRGKGRRFKASRMIEEAKRNGIDFRKLRMGSRTLRKFCREHPVGSFYVRKRAHAFAVVNGIPSESWVPLGAIILDAWQVQPVVAP